ncbi:MAG: hypothetical protein GX805_12980, partial [Gammaproteobacteria bacterium]|nr:hypothetical protein [Gammaproteobacteria bacterium]
MACALLLAPAAQAAIQVGAITLPSGGDLGVNAPAEVSVQWNRVSGPGDDVVRIEANPAGRLTFDPAPGCTWEDPHYDCEVGSGNVGSFTFSVRGAAIGGFNLSAVGLNSGTTVQSVSGNVYSSGDLTVAKTLASPAGNPLTGESMRFELRPRLAPGAMDVPVGGIIPVTDDLPATAADGFVISNVSTSSGVPSNQRVCNTVAQANASRTLTCSFSGPFTAAQFNSAMISIYGTSRSSGGFFNTAAVGASGQYVDVNPANNTDSVAYSVDAASDLAISASASSPLGTSAARMGGNGSWAFNLRPSNSGPLAVPAGAVAKAVLPADWTLDLGALPAYCSAAPGSLTLDTGNSGTGYNSGTHYSSQRGTWTGTLVTCTLPAQAQGYWPAIPLSGTLPNPAANTDGYIPMLVEVPPAPSTLRDRLPTNNGTTVRWYLAPEAADLTMWKTKTPALVRPGDTRTSSMRVYNAGPAVTSYDAANPVRVIDWLD